MATCTIEKYSEETVVHQLNELFGKVLNLDVIKRVAVSCHYDVVESSNKLLEITGFSKEDNMEKKNSKINSPNVAPVISKKSRKAVDIERALEHIKKGYKVLIIMRGVPGCGKSHLAKSIVHSTVGYNCNYKFHILSTDDYFYQNNVYQYNPDKLSEAHGWNHNRAFNALSKGYSPVIIDNTNTQMWEMKPYAMMAIDYGYIIEILEPDTHWSFNDKELAKRNSHGVPRLKIKDMLERYEKNITPQKLLNAYNLNYRLQKPPQWRLYPPLRIPNSASTNILNSNTYVADKYNPIGNTVMKSKSVSALNYETIDRKTETKEIINLMEFNEDEIGTKSKPTIKIHNDQISITSWNQNPVDEILMYSSDATSKNSYILQPSQQNITEIILTDDSSDEDNQTTQVQKNLFPDLESAWGINENALRSWDIVTPLKYDRHTVKFPQKLINETAVVTKDASCNTEEEYFYVSKKKPFNSNSAIRVLDTVNRDINRFSPKKEPIVLKKTMLDKSCLTEDIFENYDNHMSQLLNLFPSVPKSHLRYWYNKCKGDLEWTIEFLLEAKEEISSLIEETTDDIQVDEVAPIQIDSDSSNSDHNEELTINEGKAKRSRKSSDESNGVKKLIESKIDINDEHYSRHLLKIKQLKFGLASNNLQNLQSSVCKGDQLNCTSQARCLTPRASTSKIESMDVEDSDIDFDDFEVVDNMDKTEPKPEETVELNLGNNFVSQLEEKFGDPNMGYPKGFQPVVQVPITLARQLYTFYIESVYQQMETQKQILDTLVKEDEEFARKLQAKENEQIPPQVETTSNLQEIMDEQVAQKVYQKEAEKWKDLNPDNLAARLTKQKLFNVFPNIDKNTLVEILYAHGNKYQDTVEILLASTGTDNIQGNIDNIKEPPLKEETIQEMKEAQQNCASKEYEDQQEATFYREEANRYLNRRAELYQKAQQYHQRGMTEVAQFYSGLASQQTIYFDRANNMAATAFLDEHSKRLQDFNTIDLHFLYVKEALPALDVFLDRNINLLKLSNTKQSESLQIITGRGKRSENGVSKIRPAVMARLKRREIKFVQLNPGLLKAKVTKNSLVTSEFLS